MSLNDELDDARRVIARENADREWEIAVAFKQTFELPSAERFVLPTLSAYCYAKRTTITDNWRDTFLLEGRRQAWLMIQEQISITREQINEANGLSPEGR